ncbi:hypothetical protein LINPERHAP1_LOCUS18733 [Linum perenne]
MPPPNAPPLVRYEITNNEHGQHYEAPQTVASNAPEGGNNEEEEIETPVSKKQKGKTRAPVWQDFHVVYVHDSKLGREIRKENAKGVVRRFVLMEGKMALLH